MDEVDDRKEALPLEIPSTIEVDLSQLTDPAGTIRVSDLVLGPNITLMTDTEEVVARIEALRVEEVEEAVPGAAEEPAASICRVAARLSSYSPAR